ncbi:hypothetical protein AGMMS49944_22330 [Spirochaetia bacterium]|nr:hypothetical protein AGMMS49944_22330 [Spirochaetia bacterium]
MPATEKVGNIRKCPACGAEVDSFQTRCSSCGHEFNKVGVSEGISDFFTRYDTLLNDKTGTAVRSGKSSIFRILQIICVSACVLLFIPLFSTWPYVFMQLLIPIFIPLVLALVFAFFIEPKWTQNDEQRKELIATFPLPNSRADIIEFVIMASSRMEKTIPVVSSLFNSGKYKVLWNSIWIKKLAQVYNKARLSMSSTDPESLKAVQNVLREAKINL